jgi:DNA-binding beta-propeller fold protein YncE
MCQFSAHSQIIKKHEIRDGISPKSIVSSGTGLFSAQNMMYRHTVTIYNKDGERLAKIKDGVNLKKYGFTDYQKGNYLGGPVEAVFTKDGNYLWVSNYIGEWS